MAAERPRTAPRLRRSTVMQSARVVKEKSEARRASTRASSKQSPLRKTRPRTANAVPKKTIVSIKEEVKVKSKSPNSRVEWGRINVFVRGRPLSKTELTAGAFDSLEIADKNTTFLHEFCASDDYLRMKRLKTRQYQFDHVFNMFDTQRCVYDTTTAPLVESVLNGQNASCFCYGATGTGKTHTMLGSVDDPGIMVLAFQNLFKSIEEDPDTSVTLTYVEIYNEALKDLLNPNGGDLCLRELPGKGVTMNGVKEVSASSAEEVVNLLHKGNKHRKTESTRCNRTSSRSHALLQIKVVRKDENRTLTGKLSLVDLAGSERTIANEKKSSSRSVEGANINKSLLSLSSCIRALVEGKKHIPFRNSKLTQMLKDSLGGMCQTAMIATVTPSSFSLGETANTLHWAERAKMIKLPGARTKHERIIKSHPLASAMLPSLREDKAEKENRAPVRAKKLQSLQKKHSDLTNKLSKIGNTRSSRKRLESQKQEELEKSSAKLGLAEARIGELEHEVKRLKKESEAQKSDFESQIEALRVKHEEELAVQLKEKDELIQSLLASSNKIETLHTATQCAAVCKSTANQAMTPVFKAYMDEKMRECGKENSSPITRLELPMTPRH
ncbi:kinesin [Chloropicon primus]|uniref:Kinesin-like protein n=1 Tax=Chloropicon primus TaxID=1764295 RepID=A0A5B8MSJ6_9CHLO|nr:kinesin [Chloropicon primus]UPR02618.1 kinesin [Chloropicon primus]|eukprot:QDZ23406.1 kinesin [Chloropicon primus]